MKKLLKLLAVGFLSIGVLAACDGDVEDPADPGINDDDPAVDDSVDEPGDELGDELEGEDDGLGDELEDEDDGF